MMRVLLAVAGAMVLLAGCYRTPPLAPGADAVRLTFTPDAVKGCTSKGIVQAYDGRGGLFYKGQAKRGVDHKLRNSARELGANTILLSKLTNGFSGSSGVGEAFACSTM